LFNCVSPNDAEEAPALCYGGPCFIHYCLILCIILYTIYLFVCLQLYVEMFIFYFIETMERVREWCRESKTTRVHPSNCDFRASEL